MKIVPALLDFSETAGSADGHYFWQDLICARWIFEESPERHLDVGSRIDGFVGHLLTFMEVTLLDIRRNPMTLQGLRFIRGDAQDQLVDYENKFDSVSSLHSIEHFGLGRYGDTIQIDGHERGLKNISQCVSQNGKLYVSFPIGNQSIEFNSQRILDPLWPIEVLNGFELLEFVLIPWRGSPIFNSTPSKVNLDIRGQAGLYKFKKLCL